MPVADGAATTAWREAALAEAVGLMTSCGSKGWTVSIEDGALVGRLLIFGCMAGSGFSGREGSWGGLKTVRDRPQAVAP